MQQLIKSPFHDELGEWIKLLAIVITAGTYITFMLFFAGILLGL